MFKLNEIRELIRMVDRSGIAELRIEKEDGGKLVIRKQELPAAALPAVPLAADAQQAQPQAQGPGPGQGDAPPSPPAPASVLPQTAATQPAVPEQPARAAEEGLHKIVSPMVGTFYRAPAPDAEPFVKKGDRVKEDTVVCIIEAMKLFNEIEAEVSGEIVDILVENGQLVEYGQPLFLVKKD
ncbi:acetyl-CoA carboxylase biotin carboxyl carrier protein [Bacillaceae bacterium]